MLWIAALLSLISWGIGRESGFLGSRVHIFLLLAILAVLAALLPPPSATEAASGDDASADAVTPGPQGTPSDRSPEADVPDER